ncbi:hypothetical protein OAS86_01140 [Gammaproteobacteria bacterium]|nr:hypothetical protein [Gammaproteobacteria bacterium]
MNKTLIAGLVLALLTSACSSSPQGVTNEPSIVETHSVQFVAGEGVVVNDTLEVSATVTAVDKVNRTLSMVDSDGHTTHLGVHNDVINFEQIEVGDAVVAAVTNLLALQLADPSDNREEEMAEVRIRAAAGEKPGAAVVDTISGIMRVEMVDLENRIVVVSSADGDEVNSVVLQVPENIPGLETVSVGDDVRATYATAIALAVRVAE